MHTQPADLGGGLDLVGQLLAQDNHLGVLVTSRPGRDEPSIAVVNAAVMRHPLGDEAVIGLVARPGIKLANLRRQPRATLVARASWEWAAVAGPVELAGPDDPHPGIGPEALRLLLRRVYLEAGGNHPDLEQYDRVMAEERRCVVLIHPNRTWTNPPGAEHIEPEEHS